MSWRHDYRKILSFMLEYGTEELNARTGQKILRVPFIPTINVDCLGQLPLIDLRKTYPSTAAAEAAWFIRGEQDTSWVSRYTKIWEKFEEPLGHSFLGGKASFGVKAAYGYRWRKHFKVDQIRQAIAELTRDPSSRRVWVTAWDPNEDLKFTGQKNVPCPVGFSLFMYGNLLCSQYVLRSSDLYVGLPYDVMTHAFTLQAIASSLPFDCRVGAFQVCISHPHVYTIHKEMALEALAKPAPDSWQEVRLPQEFEIESIGKMSDMYVQFVKDIVAEKTDWPELIQWPEVVL